MVQDDEVDRFRRRGGSIKKIGLYDKVKELLSGELAEYVELIVSGYILARILEYLALNVFFGDLYHVVVVSTGKSLVSGQNIVSDLPGLTFLLLVDLEEGIVDL